MAKSHTACCASDDGPTPEQLTEFFQQIRLGHVTKKKLQKFLQNGTPTPSQKEDANIIMGNDFINPENILATRVVFYTNEQLKQLADTLPSEKKLRWCKDNNYPLMAGPPRKMSLLDIRSAKSSLFYCKTEGWFAKQPFAANDKVECRWLAIHKNEVPNSLNKNWNTQQKLLSKDEEVPNAAEISWFITTYYEVRSVRLFERIFVRTSSVTLDGNHVYVGYNGKMGLNIHIDRDDYQDCNLGVSACLKPSFF